MPEKQRDQEGILESLADEPTREKLAKARQRTRTRLAKTLKVSEETVRRSQKRADLYLSILRQYVERRGGTLRLEVVLPDQPPVILAGLSGDSGQKKAKKKAGAGAQSKAKTGRAA